MHDWVLRPIQVDDMKAQYQIPINIGWCQYTDKYSSTSQTILTTYTVLINMHNWVKAHAKVIVTPETNKGG